MTGVRISGFPVDAQKAREILDFAIKADLEKAIKQPSSVSVGFSSGFSTTSELTTEQEPSAPNPSSAPTRKSN